MRLNAGDSKLEQNWSHDCNGWQCYTNSPTVLDKFVNIIVMHISTNCTGAFGLL